MSEVSSNVGVEQSTSDAMRSNSQWEYKVISFDMAEKWNPKKQQAEIERFQERLNELGREGWEMISYEGVQMYGSISKNLKGSAYLLFLKRRISGNL
jgi:hypothetical protein